MQKVQKALLRSGKISGKFLVEPNKGGAFSSVEIFASKKAGPSPAGAPEKSAAMPKARKTAPQMKGTALLKYGSHEMKCMIKTISDETMSVISRRPTDYPSVLQKIIVDISPAEPGKTSVNSLDSYVHGICAVEKRIDADFLNFDIHFIDEDSSRIQELSKFLDEVGQFGHW